VAAFLVLVWVSLDAHSASGAFVYVGNGGFPGTDTISQFGSDAGGLLAPLTPASITAEANPVALTASPDGQNLYAATQAEGGSVAQFAIAANGTLQPLSPASLPVGGRPTGIAESPDGRFVYVTNFEGSGAVAQFAVGPGGALAPLSPSAVPLEGASAIAISPDGRHAYVADGETTGFVWQLEVAANGTLQPLSPASVQVGSKPYGIAVSPDGRDVYVVDNHQDLQQLAVGADGTLQPLSPPSVATSEIPISIALSPDGHSLFCAEVGAVEQFDRHADGTLAPRPTTTPAGGLPWALAVSPDGQSVYVTDESSPGANGLWQFGLDSLGGLQAKTPMSVNTEANPDAIAIALQAPPAQPPAQTPAVSPPSTAAAATSPGAPIANAIATGGARTSRGQTFTFDATLSVDPYGRIVSYIWTLDGHVISTALRFHRFFSASHHSYRITLTVRDDHGHSDSTVVTVSPSARHAPILHITIPATATFCIDCAELSAPMAALVRGLRHYARGAKLVSIASYADATGSRAHNLALTHRRSQAIARVLLSGLLPRPQRIALSWYGESDPVASNATAAGRARNRRSTIRIVR
jgi:DNA-binding beta-propeller fold protein YncE